VVFYFVFETFAINKKDHNGEPYLLQGASPFNGVKNPNQEHVLEYPRKSFVISRPTEPFEHQKNYASFHTLNGYDSDRFSPNMSCERNKEKRNPKMGSFFILGQNENEKPKGVKHMKKMIMILMIFAMILPSMASAQGMDTYIVQRGDSLWKIAVKYQIGLDEIINANKQIPNPRLIYPNQKINVPNIDATKNVETSVLTIVNQERSKAGLKPLQMDWELQRVARIKACDMATTGYFSHQSPDYGSPFDMMKNYGISYRTAGENIAKGQRTPQEVMNAWMNSTGHRANILKGDFTHIGVGYCEQGNHWVQMFIGK